MNSYFANKDFVDYRSNMTQSETFNFVINYIFKHVINPSERLTVADYDHVVEVHNTFCVDDPLVSPVF